MWTAMSPCWHHSTWGRTDIKFRDVSIEAGVIYAVSVDGYAFCRGKYGEHTWQRVGQPQLSLFDKVQADNSLVSVAVLLPTVWALTSGGRVVAREGVTEVSPTGASWTLVGSEFGMRSLEAVGGRLFSITASGQILVRHGVGPSTPLGTHWVNQHSGCIWMSELPLLPRVEEAVDGGRATEAEADLPIFSHVTGWGHVLFGLSQRGLHRGIFCNQEHIELGAPVKVDIVRVGRC